uniref:Transmembrane protein n=1 Tax=Macrostomum lignano TaxID=282301 RepID=A0A1I8GPF8_9PLAT
SLPRLRRLIDRGRRRGRRKLRLLTPPPYNYKSDCAGAQKLFYIGFVLSSIASVVFLISFVFNSGSGGAKAGGADELSDGNSTLATPLPDARPSTAGSGRRQLGLFETLALLCSAFGLCLIAGVFLCGLYVTRRMKDMDEEKLIATGGAGSSRQGCWDADDEDDDCEDDATQTTETPAGELSSYSIASAVGSAAQQRAGLCTECGCRRTSDRQGADDEQQVEDLDEDLDLDDEEDDEDLDNTRATRTSVDSNESEMKSSNNPAEAAVRQALNSNVPRRLRRCTCAQISTVSRLSD